MYLKVAILPGDGIGPEISSVGLEVLRAVCERFDHVLKTETYLIGAAAIDAVGNPFPPQTLKGCQEADAVLFSAVGDPRYDHAPEAKVRPEQGLLAMRKELGLFANIRPITAHPAFAGKSPLKDEIVRGADLVCIRELTGGAYFGEKFESDERAYDMCVYTRREIERILHVAFKTARQRRRHLTVVDKANVLASSRLWRKVAQELAADYPDVDTDYMFVDNAAMKLIQDPRFFDVIVTENTFGDILTDEASVISGSMGLLPSASIGTGTPVFEPIHGSWPEAAGKGIANPLAQVLSVAMLFDHFEMSREAELVRKAVNDSITAGIVTPDLDPKSGYSTLEVGEFLVRLIGKYDV